MLLHKALKRFWGAREETSEADLPKGDDDRTEWDEVWRTRPLRQLTGPVQIEVLPIKDHNWGEVLRVEIVTDPPQFAHLGWRGTETCPVCGAPTSADLRIAVTIYPYFANGASLGIPAWAHEQCFAGCEEVAGPSPVPW